MCLQINFHISTSTREQRGTRFPYFLCFSFSFSLICAKQVSYNKTEKGFWRSDHYWQGSLSLSGDCVTSQQYHWNILLPGTLCEQHSQAWLMRIMGLSRGSLWGLCLIDLPDWQQLLCLSMLSPEEHGNAHLVPSLMGFSLFLKVGRKVFRIGFPQNSGSRFQQNR